MKRYNDDFDLHIYNEFKSIAQENDSNIKDLINKKIPIYINSIPPTESEIKQKLYSEQGQVKATRSIAVNEENRKILKGVVDKLNLSFREILTYIMIEVVQAEKRENESSLEFLYPGKSFKVPENIYEVESDIYRIITVNDGFPDHLISDEISNNIYNAFVMNEELPEETLNGFWCCIESVGIYREKYWVPEIFLRIVENNPEIIIESFKWVLDKINYLDEDSYENIYFTLETNRYQSYRGPESEFENKLNLKKIIYSNSEELEDFSEIEDKDYIEWVDIIVDIENLSLKELYVVFSQNNIEEIEKEYVNPFEIKTKSDIFLDFKNIAEKENKDVKLFLEETIKHFLPKLTEKELIENKYYNKYTLIEENPYPEEIKFEMSKEIRLLIKEKMENFETDEIEISHILDCVMYKKVLGYYGLEKEDNGVKVGDVLKLDEFPQPNVRSGTYYVKGVSQGYPVHLIPNMTDESMEGINDLLQSWVNWIKNRFIMDYVLREKWYYIESVIEGEGHSFEDRYWIPKYVLDMKLGIMRTEINSDDELIGMEHSENSKILNR